ncbi:P2Y purinoceptor 3 [Girardinichthys multiradiatus]|uniref:P2Y purinoceptor 3 n=1 Tax=Girardinichthys multiradiatus TaxID=208333 RepID=UPI001FAB9AD5|nr:P2Y purinoceptor 3 [Girardinichthys multiradiatus]
MMGLNRISSTTPYISFLASTRLNTSTPSSLPPSSCSIDESYKYVFLPVCYSLTFLFSLVLNSVVLLRSCCPHGAGASSGRRWNTSLIYMVNLATTDLMYGLSLPFLVASYVLRDHWVFGDFMCRLVRFLFYFNLYCSIFFLTCISVHRYLGICHPMRTITLESKRVVKATCASVWVVVFVLTCPIFRFAQTGEVTRRSTGAVEPEGMRFGDNRTEEKYVNCWDDAIDKDFAEYVPYGIVLHLLGFFVPFGIIAWCYSQVVRTIFQSLRSPPSSIECGEDGAVGDGAVEGGRDRERTSVSISGSQYSHYIRRRRKSIKTIVTITLLFALCFLPFHVTRTLFLLLRRGQLGGCNAMKAVSICYKVTRPLASCNAWLNALLYFLTGDKGAPCCWPERTVHQDKRNGPLWWPLTILKKEGAGEDDQEVAEKVERELQMEDESKSSRILF